MNRLAFTFVLLVTLCGLSAAQPPQPVQVDWFSKASNDDLMARVDHFQTALATSGSLGFVILRGTTLNKHLNQRRIQGCNRWRKFPLDNFSFIFDETQASPEIEFWSVPKHFEWPKFIETRPDYRLTDIDKPRELSVSMGTDEYCPRYFDLDWYSKFMKANPSFAGKVVIDASRREFLSRVVNHRRKLAQLGVESSRVRFFRHHFTHERDEQWWLIPPKRK